MSDPGKDIDAPAAPAVAAEPIPAWRRLLGRYAWRLVAAVVVLDILAFMFVPPYPKDEPGHPITGIGDLIIANLEIPAPHIVVDLAPDPNAPPPGLVSFHPSISAPIVATWLVMAIVLIWGFLSTRRMRDNPGRYQNFIELTFEKLEEWAVSLGGEAARKHIPVFIAFFLFILVPTGAA